MSQTFRIGLFVIAGLTILTLGVFMIGSNDFLFDHTYRLRAQFANVSGLAEGADVRVGGLRRGTVHSIELPNRPDGKVTVFMNLSMKTRNIIKTDSKAAIKSEGLLGDKFVEVTFGSPDAPEPKPGDLIGSEQTRDMADLMAGAGDLLQTANSTMQNIDSITTKMNSGTGTLGALINDKKMYQDARAATVEAQQGAAAFHDNMEALQHNFFLRGFFKNRGYHDESDVAANEIQKLPTEQPAKEFDLDGEQIFAGKDNAKLKNEGRLSDAGKYLAANPFSLTVIADSTSMLGDSKKNLSLSAARAYVVRDYLIGKFKMDDTKVKTIGLGEDKDSADSTKGQVRILVYTNAVAPASAPAVRHPGMK